MAVIAAMPLGMSLRLTVVVSRTALVSAFQQAFSQYNNVGVVHSLWEDLTPQDCFVTAGNSYGLMSAGIDAAIVHELGEQIEKQIQVHIMNHYLGEQPVGTAFLLPTNHHRLRFLCHSPTMRMPGDISTTDHVYLATRAALLAVYHHNRSNAEPISQVVVPAMGTGFGTMTPEESARQMAVAWRLFLEPPYPPNWDRALHRERLISG